MTAKKVFFGNAANINIDSDLYPTLIPSVIQWNPTVITVKTNFRYTNLTLANLEKIWMTKYAGFYIRLFGLFRMYYMPIKCLSYRIYIQST